MSPEQIQQAPLNARSDIFSLGLVMYEAFSGEKFISSKDPQTALRQIADFPSQRSKSKKIPDSVLPIITKSLNFDPLERHRSMKELREDLLKIVSEIGIDECKQSLVKILSEEFQDSIFDAQSKLAYFSSRTVEQLGLETRGPQVSHPTSLSTPSSPFEEMLPSDESPYREGGPVGGERTIVQKPKVLEVPHPNLGESTELVISENSFVDIQLDQSLQQQYSRSSSEKKRAANNIAREEPFRFLALLKKAFILLAAIAIFLSIRFYRTQLASQLNRYQELTRNKVKYIPGKIYLFRGSGEMREFSGEELQDPELVRQLEASGEITPR